MSVKQMLKEKEKELAAVAASIAAGCQPCTAHHFEAAWKAGATEVEIRRAVNAALSVRQNSTRVMAGLAQELLGGALIADGLDCDGEPLVHELVSASAALAINCATSLENHLGAAIRLGASDRQVQSVLGVARMVRKVAGQKAEAAAGFCGGSDSPVDGEVGGERVCCGREEASGTSADDAAAVCLTDEVRASERRRIAG